MLATLQTKASEVGDDPMPNSAGLRRECRHLVDADDTPDPEPSGPGCDECAAEGTDPVHLRMCLACGHVGCCDSSVGRHATRHHEETGHPVMRSAESGETWRWCYLDEIVG